MAHFIMYTMYTVYGHVENHFEVQRKMIIIY